MTDMTSDQLHRTIGQHGWAVVTVEADANEPSLAYTVGLSQQHDHPEVIMFGLRTDVMQEILNSIGKSVESGHRFSSGDTADLLEGYACIFRPVDPAAVRHFMGVAVEYYAGDVRALHCIWPDRDGRFPWESGVSPEYRQLQPMLSDGPDLHTLERPG